MAAVATVAAAQVSFGFKAGVNVAKESPMVTKADGLPIAESISFKTGFHAGVLMNVKLTSMLELEPSLMYSLQGYYGIIESVGEEQIIHKPNYHVNSHYLNVPVALKLFLNRGLYLEAGPQVGYLLKKKDKFDDFDNENSFTSDNTKKLDFSLFGGLGYRFNEGIFIEARYAHGLTGTSKLFRGGKNRNIQISLGYSF